MTGDVTSFTKKRMLQGTKLSKVAATQGTQQTLRNVSFRSMLLNVFDQQLKNGDLPTGPNKRRPAQSAKGDAAKEACDPSTSAKPKGGDLPTPPNYGYRVDHQNHHQEKIFAARDVGGVQHATSVSLLKSTTAIPHPELERAGPWLKSTTDAGAPAGIGSEKEQKCEAAAKMDGGIRVDARKSAKPGAVFRGEESLAKFGFRIEDHHQKGNGLLPASYPCFIVDNTIEVNNEGDEKNLFVIAHDGEANTDLVYRERSSRKKMEVGLQQLRTAFMSKLGSDGKDVLKRSAFTNKKALDDNQAQTTEDSACVDNAKTNRAREEISRNSKPLNYIRASQELRYKNPRLFSSSDNGRDKPAPASPKQQRCHIQQKARSRSTDWMMPTSKTEMIPLRRPYTPLVEPPRNVTWKDSSNTKMHVPGPSLSRGFPSMNRRRVELAGVNDTQTKPTKTRQGYAGIKNGCRGEPNDQLKDITSPSPYCARSMHAKLHPAQKHSKSLQNQDAAQEKEPTHDTHMIYNKQSKWLKCQDQTHHGWSKSLKNVNDQLNTTPINSRFGASKPLSNPERSPKRTLASRSSSESPVKRSIHHTSSRKNKSPLRAFPQNLRTKRTNTFSPKSERNPGYINVSKLFSAVSGYLPEVKAETTGAPARTKVQQMSMSPSRTQKETHSPRQHARPTKVKPLIDRLQADSSHPIQTHTELKANSSPKQRIRVTDDISKLKCISANVQNQITKGKYPSVDREGSIYANLAIRNRNGRESTKDGRPIIDRGLSPDLRSNKVSNSGHEGQMASAVAYSRALKSTQGRNVYPGTSCRSAKQNGPLNRENTCAVSASRRVKEESALSTGQPTRENSAVCAGSNGRDKHALSTGKRSGENSAVLADKNMTSAGKQRENKIVVACRNDTDKRALSTDRRSGGSTGTTRDQQDCEKRALSARSRNGGHQRQPVLCTADRAQKKKDQTVAAAAAKKNLPPQKIQASKRSRDTRRLLVKGAATKFTTGRGPLATKRVIKDSSEEMCGWPGEEGPEGFSLLTSSARLKVPQHVGQSTVSSCSSDAQKNLSGSATYSVNEHARQHILEENDRRPIGEEHEKRQILEEHTKRQMVEEFAKRRMVGEHTRHEMLNISGGCENVAKHLWNFSTGEGSTQQLQIRDDKNIPRSKQASKGCVMRECVRRGTLLQKILNTEVSSSTFSTDSNSSQRKSSCSGTKKNSQQDNHDITLLDSVRRGQIGKERSKKATCLVNRNDQMVQTNDGDEENDTKKRNVCVLDDTINTPTSVNTGSELRPLDKLSMYEMRETLSVSYPCACSRGVSTAKDLEYDLPNDGDKDFDEIVSQLFESSNEMAKRAMGLRKSINELKLQTPKMCTRIVSEMDAPVIELSLETSKDGGWDWRGTLWDYLMLLAFMALQLLAQYVFVKR